MSSAQRQFKGTERFRLIRPLGEGGMGRVYEAEDRQRGQLVAVKTLRYSEPSDVARLKREFRALADLSHPNLVDLYDMVIDEAGCFFTMELVEGEGFISYCRDASANVAAISPSRADTDPDLAGTIASAETPGMLFDEVKLRSALPQLVRGLRALHGAGMVHRDIKPPNVLVTHSGRVVILDFGLVLDVDDWASDSMTGRVVGTVEYMAPEQAVAERAVPASDWYSFGCLLYEVLTGRLPFEGSAMRVLLDRQEKSPPPPRVLCPSVPEDLNRLCAALLVPRPEDRPNADDILEMLGEEKPSDPGDSRTLSLRADGAPFTGREAELRAIEICADEVEPGRPGVVVVRGPSGIGKTSLIRRFLDSIGDDKSFVVLEGRCYDSEIVPFKAIDNVLDQLARFWSLLPAEEAAELLPGQAALLPRLFPALSRVPAVAGAPWDQANFEPSELRGRATEALRYSLRRLAAKRHLIIFLDDLQWADADSLSLLVEILSGPDAPGLLLLLGVRADRDRETSASTTDGAISELGDGDSLTTFLAALDTVIRLIDVGPLSLEAATLVAKSMLRGVSEQVAERVARESRGIPFIITELALYLQTLSADERVPISLEEALRARIDQLPDSARQLIELVAVAGHPISQRVAASALETSPESLARIIRHLRTTRMLRAPGGRATDRVECYHNRIRESIRADMTSAQRTAYHRSVAVALEQWSEASADQLVVHWDGAGDRARAARFAVAAAEESALTFNFNRAAHFYRLAVRLGDFQGARLRELRRSIASALASAGRAREASAAWQDAAEGADAAESLEHRHNAAVVLIRGGFVDEGVAQMRQMLSEVGCRPAKSRRGATLRALWRRTRIRMSSSRAGLVEESEVPRRALIEMDLSASIALSLSMVDPLVALDFQGRSLVLAHRYREKRRWARAMALEACFSAGFGDYDRAMTLAERGEEAARGVDDLQATAMVELARALVSLYQSSDLRMTLHHISDTMSALRQGQMGDSWEMSTVRMFEFDARLKLGQLADLDRRATRFIRSANRRGDRYAARSTRLRLGQLWLALGRPLTREQIDAWRSDSGGAPFERLWFRLARAEIDLYAGEEQPELLDVETDEAGTRLRDLHRLPPVVEHSAVIVGRVNLARAAAGKAESRQRAVREVSRCATTLERSGAPLSMAQASTFRAALSYQEGNDEGAAEYLRAAIRAFETIGAAAHEAVARRALGLVIGGDEGGQQIRAAREWMERQGVVDDEAYGRVLIPGLRR